MIIPKPKKSDIDDGFYSVPNYQDFASVAVERVRNDKIAEEGYRIYVTADGIKIEFSSPRGLFYGETSLEQLLAYYGEKLPFLSIEDEPSYAYRGYMLDVGRYFFPIEDIFKQIDYLAKYKINVLHLHLTEDQGWRVEIKKYPLLTKLGSARSRTAVHPTPHKGYYTQTDLKKIVNYAHSRHISVIPELELPGHFSSAIASYPHLGCFDRKIAVANNFGVKYEVACYGKDSTMAFIKDVIDELCEIFTDKYFHIGGDEVPYARWQKCPRCQAKLKALGLKNWAEYQAVFMNEVSDYLKTKGKTAIMWNEARVTNMVNKDIIWQYWQGGLPVADLVAEVNSGRKIINSSSNPCYLDLPYSINTLPSVYSYHPNIEGITRPENILGAEYPLWTELVPNQKQAEKMTFPRLTAGAEAGWGTNNDYEDFCKRYDRHRIYLKSIGVSPAKKRLWRPSKFTATLDKIWWERRKLYWGALTNLVSTLKLNALLKKQKR